MKKVVLLIITLFVILTCSINVNAKDTVYSLNKYENERLTIIDKSYSKDNKVDGFIVAGTYKLKDNINKVLYAKFSDTGSTLWSNTIKKDNIKDSNISSLVYTYDDQNKVNGYALIINITDSDDNIKNIILKTDLDGKEIEEKEIDASLTKIIPIKNNLNIEGYISIGTIDNTSYIIKYDKSFNEVLKVENDDVYTDITPIYKDSNIIGYAAISRGDTNTKLIKYDSDIDNKTIIKENNDTSFNPMLEISNDGFIVYGLTNELKLTDNKSTSYFIYNYNSSLEENNESIGTTPINKDKIVKLLPIISNNKIKEYLLLYINDIDSSIEVVKINTMGEEQEKIKKINNTYYDITNFNFKNNTLYIIGQINCPKDENCDYNNNSLFLISDQDKVIEVKQSDNKVIIITTIVLFSLIIILVAIRKVLRKN